MSLLSASIIPFKLYWYEAVNSGQSAHRFHSHSETEYECFVRMLEKNDQAAKTSASVPSAEPAAE